MKMKNKEKNVRLNTVILTNVKVKSINDISINSISSNKLRGDAIRLGYGMLVMDHTIKYLRQNSPREEFNDDEFILEEEV